MDSKIKFSLYIVIALFLLIQFVPVARDNPVSNAQSEIMAPDEVKTVLKTSCYDCHSNQTVWPFYSYIAPMSWLVAGDVKEGREELNFSVWIELSTEKKEEKREEIIEEISEGKMPLPVYLIIHPSARLSDKQKQVLKNWFNANIKD